MIKIGAIGHIHLNNTFKKLYKRRVAKKLTELKKRHTDLVVFSSLANGADRLALHEAIKLNIDFTAVLPMDKKTYHADFNCNSKKEFDNLLKKAKDIIIMPHNHSFNRNIQYELAGYYISDNSDILLALWDGKYNNLKGGTSETVKYHLSQNKELWHLKVDRKSI